MKLSTLLPGAQSVTAVGNGYVAVGGRRFERSLLIKAGGIDADWGPDQPAALNETHIAALVSVDCDVLLLGTGKRQVFPPAALLRPLVGIQRGIEVMDTAAACRTYNILLSEGRAVAAALIVE